MPRAKTAPKPTPKPVAPQLDLALLSEWQPVAGVVAAVLAGNADAALTGLRAEFRFAVQECFKPYALSVVALGPQAEMLAEKKVLYALDAWRAARKRNDWIGYARRTCYASLPPWHEAQWLEKELR